MELQKPKPKQQIPDNAKRVFKGIIFDVYQWEQELFDGSKTIFEKLKRLNTAETIAIVGNKILIQIEKQPSWTESRPSIPGGRIEKDEPLEAAKRELLEETGYISKDWVLWTEIDPVFKIEYTVFSYIARNCVLEKEPNIDAGEKIETRLVSFNEFMRIATEDALFYSPEIVPNLLRMQLDPKKLEEFKNLLGLK